MYYNKSIIAILGATNTGKTYLALDRMMSYASGMIGFPLRLLARENYDKVCKIKGKSQVALITGEERIIPPQARYFLCTVESMPTWRQVEFLGVDEIQLCGHPHRGHIFTDRLLYARGISETMFMGADTIEQVIRNLIPDIEIVKRPRMSNLAWAGSKRLTRLKPRSAIVAFSASNVYQMAELIKRQKGGAGIVLGALSPRTRNAQVEMYQNGDVDYLVATDAIGMGLNMDVEHVAFSDISKFDGNNFRDLTSPELAQIAGRAGRSNNDGTFGITANCPMIDTDDIFAIENHDFRPISHVYWRNSDLDFSSLKNLRQSLKVSSPHLGLIRVKNALDEEMLKLLTSSSAVSRTLTSKANLNMLWDVCQVPDFSKYHNDSHLRMLANIYSQMIESGHIHNDYIYKQLKHLENTSGTLDSLTNRLSDIRTWSFITQRSKWLDTNEEWASQTREIENKLSDALHQRLTETFVDQQTSILLKSLRDRKEVYALMNHKKEIHMEGVKIATVEGFSLKMIEENIPSHSMKIFRMSAIKSLAYAVDDMVDVFLKDEKNLSLNHRGKILWCGKVIAKIKSGDSILKPNFSLYVSEAFGVDSIKKITDHLRAWLYNYIRSSFDILTSLDDKYQKNNKDLSPMLKGILWQLKENIGSLNRQEIDTSFLTKADKSFLKRNKIVVGKFYLYIPSILRGKIRQLKSILMANFDNYDLNNYQIIKKIYTTKELSNKEYNYNSMVRISYVEQDKSNQSKSKQDKSKQDKNKLSHILSGGVNIETYEKINSLLWKVAKKGEFHLDDNLHQQLKSILKDESLIIPLIKSLSFKEKKKNQHFKYNYQRSKKEQNYNENSPFAVLLKK